MIWFNGSIPDAIAEAKRNNNLFLVYIEGQDEMSKIMTEAYNENEISRKLSKANVVALKLVPNSQSFIQFSAIYPVLVIPSSYFIGRNGVAIEIITGGLSSDQFSSKLDKIFQVHQAGGSAQKVDNSSTEVVASGVDKNLPSTSNSAAAVPEEPSMSKDSEDALAKNVQLEKIKSLIKSQHEAKAVEEQEKEKKEELERRNTGKALQQAQNTRHENELKELAKTRAKEKEEDRLAREKVKAMIAQDRAERAARYEMMKEQEQTQSQSLREAQEREARNAAMNSNEARLQFRLPDGSHSTRTFSADASLQEVRSFIVNEVHPPFSNFTLCMTFPRRQFTESNYSETLRDLQLAPSAVLLVLPAPSTVSVSGNGGFLRNLLWTLLSPMTAIWRMITSLFPARPPAGPQEGDQEKRESTTAESSQSTTRRREPNFYKREGNVYRINNQSDDDENNTWNGNSTQQM